MIDLVIYFERTLVIIFVTPSTQKNGYEAVVVTFNGRTLLYIRRENNSDKGLSGLFDDNLDDEVWKMIITKRRLILHVFS